MEKRNDRLQMKKRIVRRIITILKWRAATRFRWVVCILVIFSLLAGFVFFLVFKPQTVEAAWWNDSWQYRKPIPITNDTTAQSAVYIPITIDTSDTTRFNADCGDLRFTNINGELLPYYIVSGCRTASTVVNVYFDNLIAGGSTVYYYYGNPSASQGASLIDFTSVASSYTVGSIGAEEKGTGPVGYWSFDEGYGTTANDETANRNIGTLTNMSSTASSTSGWQTEDKCVSGKCLAFDGVNDYVTIPDSDNLDLSNSSLTISFWIKPVSWSQGDSPISKKADDNSEGYVIYNDGTHLGKMNFRIRGSDGNNLYLYSSSNVDNGVWQYWVVVFDSSAGTVKWYKNSSLDKTYTSISVGSISSTAPLYMGRSQTWGGYSNGFLDEPKIYNYARSASQIKMDYNAGLAGTGGRAAAEGVAVSAGKRSAQWLSNGLVGWWKMDEAAGTWNGTAGEVVDWSGNGKNGTAAGTVGGTASTTAGKFGNGGNFDGTDDYIHVPTAWSKKTSLSYWIKFDSLGAQAIISPCAYTSCDFSTGFHRRGFTALLSTNKLQLLRSTYIDGCGWNGITFYSNKDDFQAGEWYHIVETWDSQDDNIARVYINGEFDNSTPVTHSCRWDIPHYYLGRGSTSQGQLNGSMDDVRVYNSILSDREIRDLYGYAPGPVGWWKMEEGSGQYAYDSSGNGNTGTLGSGATADSADPSYVAGKTGKALKFDGVNDYVNAGSGSFVNLDEFTVSLWFKSIGWDAYDYLINDYYYVAALDQRGWDIKGGTANGGIGLAVRDIGCGAVYGHALYTTQLPSINEWHYFVGTFKLGGTVSIYLDGKFITSYNQNSSCPIVSSALNLEIGQRSYPGYATNSSFNGSIDDVRIYNYARTPEQIVEDMNARGTSVEGGGATAAVSASGKTNVAYWKFDEGYGTTANDSSLNKINGVISGASWSNSGKFGKALSFDGADDVVTITNTAAIDLNNNLADGFTISAWVNPASAGENNNGQIFWKGDNNYLRVGNLSGSQLDVGAGVDLATTDVAATSTSAIPINTWSQVIMTYASSTQQAKIYVNGVLKTTSSAGSGSTAAESNNLLIGGATANNFDGLIDEFKIYNFALTEDDIRVDYGKGAGLKLGSFSTDSLGVASSSAASIYCVPGSTDPCAPPVGEWKFEQGSGLSAYDTSGRGNTGTLTNGPTWANGKIGKALKFDGVNDYVSVADNSNLNFGIDSFSVSAWVKGTGYGQNVGIVHKRSGVAGWELIASSNGLADFFGDGVDYVTTPTGSINILDNNWHYVTMVIDRSINIIYYYVDGKQDGIYDFSGDNIDSVSTSGSDLQIGKRGAGDARVFSGIIDEVKIYNYARTPAQIAWDYNRGAPVGHWKMDECQGEIIHDSSGNGNNGTWYGADAGSQTTVGTCASSTPAGAWYNGSSGKRNASLNFDGTDDYVNEPTSIASAQSVGFWVYPSTASQSFLQLSSTATITSSNGTVAAGAGFASSSIYVNGKAGASIIAGAWNHIAVTTGTGITANAIKLGLVGSTYYSGQIDDVQVFNYALTPIQIETLYNSGAVRFGP